MATVHVSAQKSPNACGCKVVNGENFQLPQDSKCTLRGPDADIFNMPETSTFDAPSDVVAQ